MDIYSLAKSEFPSITNLPNLFQLFIAQLIKDFSSANFDSDFITHLKPDVQEIQFAIIDQLEKVEKISKTKQRIVLMKYSRNLLLNEFFKK